MVTDPHDSIAEPMRNVTHPAPGKVFAMGMLYLVLVISMLVATEWP